MVERTSVVIEAVKTWPMAGPGPAVSGACPPAQRQGHSERLSFCVPMLHGFSLMLDHLQLVIRDNSITACWLSGKGRHRLKLKADLLLLL